ncbi:MAG: lipopolysaccharide heptosyltransferase II [Phycisphaerae bacterium]|nr:lipopolysaccharide heptosyltransferase II [Phycisphaerae bacterium]MDD5381307.1 lipopolysaccharide heptosyltransferase II [Phycisphaerae bacterium]
MQDTKYEILVWLPSPMGDAVLCTPALRAIRRGFKSSRITFFANEVVHKTLSPSSFNDIWIQQQGKNIFKIVKTLKEHNFTHAILFKNSFSAALAVFLAGIPKRVGYAREGRGFLLTDKLYPPKLSAARFKPSSMVDYYLAISSMLGADAADSNLELLVDPQEDKKMRARFQEIADPKGPVVVIVPGGAFGRSKYWLSERFAQTADWLISNYNATVVVSVSPNPAEKQIAEEICGLSKFKLINLAEKPVSLGELKSLFAAADLVISNDTGPRHIAIALRRKVISLFGPNSPAWTETGYKNEIQIIGDVPCAPCAKPTCSKSEHLCMQAITVEMVCNAAKKFLGTGQRQAAFKAEQKFTEISESFFCDEDYKTGLGELGLTSIDAVFSFNEAHNLTKDNLPGHRSRLRFEINSPPATLFLKRYDSPPILVQLGNWLSAHRRTSCGFFDVEPTAKLAAAGVNTPKIVSYGEQGGVFFEKRSFIITEKIPDAESLERKLPDCFNAPDTIENLKLRRNFIAQLAAFVKKFHETGYRHRDLYLSHIFYSDDGRFYLIDLARTFKPGLLAERFQIKDIAQLYYSAPGRYFSRTDRLRFYLGYTGRRKLTWKDKVFIRRVMNKTRWMAQHDIKHGRVVPFAS